MILSRKAFLPVALSGLLSLSLTACFHDEADDHEAHHHDDAITLTLDVAEVISDPLTTGETGTATLTVHETDGELTGAVMFSGTPPDVVHVHSGFAGQTGASVITLVKDATTPAMWNIPDAEAGNITLTTLQAGGYYLNAHYGTKSTRAQIITADHIAVRVAALAAVDGVTTTGSGFAGVTVNTETHAVVAYVTVNGLTDITNVHIHVENDDSSNSQLVTLEDTATAGKTIYKTLADAAFTADALENIESARWYINVHTTTNTSGELKGPLASITHH